MDWQQIPTEAHWYKEGLKQMIAAAQIPIKRGIEIGTGWGVSGKLFLETFPSAELLSLDTNRGLPAISKLEVMFPGRVLCAPPWIFDHMNMKCQWLYIDGGHEYENVVEDLKRYEASLEVGGVIAFDDYNNSQERFYYPGVKKAVDEFMAAHPGRYTELKKPYQLPLETGPVFAIKLKGE